MKRGIASLLAVLFLVLLLSPLSARAASEIYYDGAYHTYNGNFFTLKVNGKTVDCSVPPIVFNDYSVVPARDVFETLGATVSWRAEDERVTVNYKNTQILLNINSTVAYKNGVAEKMPIAPKIINAKTMIPARYVAESLGFDVNFDSKTDTISIAEKEPEPTYSNTLKSYRITEKDETFTLSMTLEKSGAKASAFMMTAPVRLVVDILDTRHGIGITNAAPESELVTGVRFGLHADKLRVVLDLSGAHKYKLTQSGKTITVSIGKNAATITTPEEPEETQKPDEPEETPEVILPVTEIAPSRSITIDAGHGGSDPGAVYTDEDGTLWRETDINLAIAIKVRDILEKQGVRVVMTRTTEKDVALKARPELANKEETALFLSVHTNSVAGISTANGIETWGNLEKGRPLADVTDKSFAQNVQKAVIKATKAYDRGIKDSTELAVIKHSIMPSVLVEVGFITNETERANLFNDAYREKLAQGIAEGVLKTFEDMGV